VLRLTLLVGHCICLQWYLIDYFVQHLYQLVQFMSCY